jgi:hypothetical protein
MIDAIRQSPLAWIIHEKIRNEKGQQIEFGRKSSHFFLDDIYNDINTKIVVRKPSQVGVSTLLNLTEIHAAKYWGINQIHTLPTAHDVQVFVPDKVNQLIRVNPSIREGIPEKEVDAVNQKQFGKGFLYFKGTVSKRETFMLTSDRNDYDEVDRSNIREIANYSSRLEGKASLGMERWVSTPTMPGFGVDMVWEGSDQKHWRFKCTRCNTEQHMEWPDNIDMKEGKYICSKCGRELKEEDIRQGRWEARYPNREVKGYWITQMLAPWISPENMIKEYNECERGINEKTLEYFYNHKMGMPYVSSDSQIPASLIYKNLITSDHTEINSVMGVDVQLRELYVIIGSEQGVYGILILRNSPEYEETNGKEGKSKWDRLDEIMKIFDVRYGVIDGGFTPNEVIKFARKHEGKIYVNWYKEDPKKLRIIRFGEDTPFTEKSKDVNEDIKVLSDRNRLIDMTLEDLKKGRIRFYYERTNENLQEMIRHLSVCYARIVPDRVGIEKREWVSTGKDDYLHALNYFKIALIKKTKSESLDTKL